MGQKVIFELLGVGFTSCNSSQNKLHEITKIKVVFFNLIGVFHVEPKS